VRISKYISMGAFAKDGCTQKDPLLTKSYLEALYRQAVKRCESGQMDLNCFFEAVEELALKVQQQNNNNTRKNHVFESLCELLAHIST